MHKKRGDDFYSNVRKEKEYFTDLSVGAQPPNNPHLSFS